MGIADTKVGPFGMWQIIAIIGALLGIIAFFLAWGNVGGMGIEIGKVTGMDLLNSKLTSDFQKYMPLLVLVFGILSLVVSVIPAGTFSNSKITPVVALVSGLFMLVFAILFYVWWAKDFQTADIGFYLGLVGGILVLIPAVLPLFQKSA